MQHIANNWFRRARVVSKVALFMLCAFLAGCSTPPATVEKPPSLSEIGFASEEKLEQHFFKHGSEFGSIDQATYLKMAQTLRDKPAGGDILEAQRADETITRFEKSTSSFIAFNPDKVIRTFFRPNDGEAYFHRQLGRDH